MPSETSATLAFQRGILSTLALARIDLTRYRMAAETMTNWMARVLGSMTLRMGWVYTGNPASNNQSKTIPFIFGATDTARIEVTQGLTRFWVNDALLTRVAVATAVGNGTFAADISDWTNSSQVGATVTWVSAGQVSFVGTGSNTAILDQEVNVAGGDQNKLQALRILITRGPFTFRCGTTQGDDDLINETTLNTGTHSLSLTPGQSTFWIRFENTNQAASLLNSCVIEGAGLLTSAHALGHRGLAELAVDDIGECRFCGLQRLSAATVRTPRDGFLVHRRLHANLRHRAFQPHQCHEHDTDPERALRRYHPHREQAAL